MRVWFITGASYGLGALIAKEALSLGDAVVASARNPSVAFQILQLVLGCIQRYRVKKGLFMKRKRRLTIAITTAVLAVLGGTAVDAQDKYSLGSPSGITFSDFRGYEDWAVVSSARTDEVLKVIVANPTMIEAYKAGVPGTGQPFPDGSKIVKLQWKPKKSTEAPFAVDVPDIFTQAFVIEKDSKRFPKSGGWGYALFNYEAASDKFTADPSPSDCGHACHVAVKAKDHIFHPYQNR
jgi:hypothetical protein